MKRYLIGVLLSLVGLLCLSSPAEARERTWGKCWTNTAPGAQLISNACTVTVYLTGTTTIASIYSDNIGTVKANPFGAANGTGVWFFYADNGRYDVRISAGTPGITPPYTIGDILLCDGCGGGVSSLNSFTGNITITAGPNIMVMNAGNVITISSTGGGGGCTPTGGDLAVQTNHPDGTCYGSADFTWDDDNYNLNNGDGTNTLGNPMTDNTYVSQAIGSGNDITNCEWCSVIGDGNTVKFDAGAFSLVHRDFYGIGFSNTVLGSTTGGTKFMGAFGGDNDLEYGKQYVWAFGQGNEVTEPSGSGISDTVILYGYGNGVNVNRGAAGTVSGVLSFGKSNVATQNTTTTLSDDEMFGLNNRINTTNGSTPGAFIFGFDNVVDGITGTDVSVYGNSNSATNLVVNFPTYGSSNDNIQVGAQATMNNVGYGFEAGMGVGLSNCLSCGAVGFLVQNSTTNSLAIGVSATPEIKITPGVVTFSPLAGGGTQCVQVSNTGALSGSAGVCGSGGGSGTVTHTAGALTANQIVIGNGAADLKTLGSLGTTTTVLHGNAGGAPSFGAVALASDVSGQLPIAAVGSAGLSGTSPITIASTGVIACTTCVVASSPGVGIAHFAGATQTVTSSAVALGGADVTGQLPIGNVGSAGLSGTSPVAIASTGAITCTTCITTGADATTGAHVYSFAAATSLAVPVAAGGTVTANGQLMYDTTANNLLFYRGASRTVGIFDNTSTVNGDCVQVLKTGNKVELQDAGGVCGGGGGTAFSSITNGTNTAAGAMVCGSGCSLTATGSGVIGATTLAYSSLTSATNTTMAGVIGTGASLTTSGSGTITANVLAATTYSNALTFSNASNSFTGIGTGLTALNGSNISSGTVPEARLGNAVFTDASATFGAFTYNFTGSTSLRVPAASGLTASATGQIAEDTNLQNWVVWNGVSSTVGVWAAAPTNNNCVKAGVAGGQITLVDSGATCGGLPSTGSTGIVVQTAPTTTVARSIAVTSPITVTNASGTAGNPTVACATCMAASGVTTLTDGATVTWAIGSAPRAMATVTLGGNRTLALTGPLSSGSYLLKVVQDGTGSRTLTAGSGCTWKVSPGAAGAFTLSSAPNAIDVIGFTYDGTNCYAIVNTNFN